MTAKGEAQIAVVDLVGMLLGLLVSKRLGVASTLANPATLVAIYLALSISEIGAMYKEIKCVVFRSLNLERANIVLGDYVETGICPGPVEVARSERILRRPKTPRPDVFPSVADLAAGLSAADVEAHVRAAAGRDFLLMPWKDGFGVALRDGAADGAVLDALHARARAAAAGSVQEGLACASSGASELRKALRSAGWSASSFMFPEIRVRADWSSGEPAAAAAEEGGA